MCRACLLSITGLQTRKKQRNPEDNVTKSHIYQFQTNINNLRKESKANRRGKRTRVAAVGDVGPHIPQTQRLCQLSIRPNYARKYPLRILYPPSLQSSADHQKDQKSPFQHPGRSLSRKVRVVVGKGSSQCFVSVVKDRLQDDALLFAAGGLPLVVGESSAGRVLKHFADTLSILGGALDVPDGTDALSDLLALK